MTQLPPKKGEEEHFEIVDPGAEALIESLRAVDYSLHTAIADIIDNSISAKASNVWLNFHWDGPASWMSIKDDGVGELNSATRLAAQGIDFKLAVNTGPKRVPLYYLAGEDLTFPIHSR